MIGVHLRPATGRVGAMTVPTQRARNLSAPRTPTPPSASEARNTGTDVAGHGLLSRFHAGCRCGWCSSRPREGSCGYGPYRACRANTYAALPRGWQP